MSFWYLHRVLELDAPMWLKLGWVEVARDRCPSVPEWSVLIEWRGDGKPPTPAKAGA